MTPLRVEVVDDILLLRLERPERRNALDFDTLERLRVEVASVSQRGVRGVIIAGGQDYFSAGADLTLITGTSADEDFDDALERVIEAIDDCPVPVLAAIRGYCIGAAVDLVAACDLRVADANARFRVPAVHLGLLYNPSAIARLAAQLRTDLVHRLFVLAQVIDAETARETGLVSVGVGSADPVDWCRRQLADIVDADARAITETRRLVRQLASGQPLDHTQWNLTRRELLDSLARHQRVRDARKGRQP